MHEENKIVFTTQASRRHQQVLSEIYSEECDIPKLRALAWHGVPHDLRPTVWQLLLGYLPQSNKRRQETLERKRNEYFQHIALIFEARQDHQTEKHIKDLKQIEDDIPRTQSQIPLFRTEPLRTILRRLLYIWSVRHPASGYVQGINDLCSVFLLVFMQPFCSYRVTSEEGGLPDNINEIEADVFWCLTIIMDSIQDYFFPQSPGIQRALSYILYIVARVDSDLAEHFKTQNLEMIHFCFRWLNCMFVREFPLELVFRLWDSLLSMSDGIGTLSVYVGSAMVLKWASELKKKDFNELVMFLQTLNTKAWTERELEEVLSRAYLYFSWFQNSPNHLKHVS